MWRVWIEDEDGADEEAFVETQEQAEYLSSIMTGVSIEEIKVTVPSWVLDKMGTATVYFKVVAYRTVHDAPARTKPANVSVSPMKLIDWEVTPPDRIAVYKNPSDNLGRRSWQAIMLIPAVTNGEAKRVFHQQLKVREPEAYQALFGDTH